MQFETIVSQDGASTSKDSCQKDGKKTFACSNLTQQTVAKEDLGVRGPIGKAKEELGVPGPIGKAKVLKYQLYFCN